MKLKLSIVVLCAGICASIHAQSLIGATAPFGLPIQQNSGMSLSMGGVSSAVNGDYNILLSNPAGLAAVDKTVLSALLTFDFLRIAESPDHTNIAASMPQQLAVAIPFGTYGTVGVSYGQRSNHKASAQYDTTFTYNGTSAVDYSTGLSENGGLSTWQLGYGISLWKTLQVGASYERTYYSFDKSAVSELSFAQAEVGPSRDSSKTQCAFDGLQIGFVLPVSKLRIGLSGEYCFSSTARIDSALYEYAVTTAAFPVPGTQGGYSFTLRMPPSVTVGCAYDFSPEWLAAADVSLVLWKYALTGAETSDVKYAPSVSVGGQFIPAPNLLAPRYWEIIRYRAGVRYTELPSSQAYEIMGTLGVGLPLGKGAGILDIGVEGGTRLSKEFPDLTEDVLRFVIGYNGGRKWNKLTRGNY